MTPEQKLAFDTWYNTPRMAKNPRVYDIKWRKSGFGYQKILGGFAGYYKVWRRSALYPLDPSKEVVSRKNTVSSALHYIRQQEGKLIW